MSIIQEKNDVEFSKIYTVAETINRLIKIWKVSKGMARIVIDSLKNSLELMYFKEKYSAFYMLASNKNEDERNLIVSDLIDMFVGMYGEEVFGPRIQDYFSNAALLLMEQPEGGTLTEIVRVFTDPAFQKVKLQNVTNPIVRAWWEKTYAAMGEREKGEMIPFFQAKFGPFITNGIVRNILGQPKSSFDVSELMQQ